MVKSTAKFTKVDRNGFPVWVHNEKPVWIVFYEAIKGAHYVRPAFYQAYKSVHAPKKGQQPWAIDNRAILGRDTEFSSLRAAMSAADAA